MRWILSAVLVLSSVAQTQSFETTVTPLASESFAGPCHYDLALTAGHHQVRAVWVTFDRGRDIIKFYSDPDVIAFARRHNLALMMPHQCPAKNAPGGPEEMDMDPSHGVARALFTALDQFSQQSGHPELSSAKLVLLGFSGTGALFAHFVGYSPDRVITAILADPGHYNPVGMDNVRLPPAAISVPELILAGGADKISGTQRPYDYFRQYRDRGAPWAFFVQNKTPHCCIINAKSLILGWLEEITKLRQPSPTKPLRRVDDSRGWEGYIRTCPSEIRDGWGAPTWDICNARIQRIGHAAPADMLSSGWLPSPDLAMHWLEFVKQPTHSTDSLP